MSAWLDGANGLLFLFGCVRFGCAHGFFLSQVRRSWALLALFQPKPYGYNLALKACFHILHPPLPPVMRVWFEGMYPCSYYGECRARGARTEIVLL